MKGDILEALARLLQRGVANQPGRLTKKQKLKKLVIVIGTEDGRYWKVKPKPIQLAYYIMQHATGGS